MPGSLSSLTDGIVENSSISHTIGNIARAATTRHRHSTHLNSTSALPLPPPPPQHTNVAHHDPHRADQASSVPTHLSHSPTHLTTHTDQRRNSQAGLSAMDGSHNNLTIEFDGGTHVIVRPNRIIRGNICRV